MLPYLAVKKLGLEAEMIKFSEKDKLRINGLGGEAWIVGALVDITITFGNRIIEMSIGVVDKGNFEMLLGNDAACEL